MLNVKPAGRDGAVEPERVLSILRPVGLFEFRYIKHRQTVVNVAFHINLSIWLVRVHVDQPGDHVWGEGHDEGLQKGEIRFIRARWLNVGMSWMETFAYICDNRQNGNPVEDLLPGTDAVGLWGHGTPELSGELPGVNSNLDNVVEQRQQRCQGEGGHKQSDEAKLDHWDINKGKKPGKKSTTAFITALWMSSALERLLPEYLPISRYS